MKPHHLNRRSFLSLTGMAVLSESAGLPLFAKETIQTVRGLIPAEKFGLALPHEHVLCDFIGAEKTGPHRWNSDEVAQTMLPHLKAVRMQGVTGFVDCTPAFIGRDVRLLRRLAEATGLHIVTNTGLYKEPFLPPYAFTETEDQLAGRWVAEFKKGIDGSGIRPGFIKIAVNPGPLIPVQQKIVKAAARASRRTGMLIACHTAHGGAALETIALLQKEGLPLSRYVFVHAEGEKDRNFHVEVARAGGWVEYDAVGRRPVAEHVRLITQFLADGLADRLLLSHDAGWYHVGEPNGGRIKAYTALLDELVPALEMEGLKLAMRDKILIENPRRAFSLVRD